MSVCLFVAGPHGDGVSTLVHDGARDLRGELYLHAVYDGRHHHLHHLLQVALLPLSLGVVIVWSVSTDGEFHFGG